MIARRLLGARARATRRRLELGDEAAEHGEREPLVARKVARQRREIARREPTTDEDVGREVVVRAEVRLAQLADGRRGSRGPLSTRRVARRFLVGFLFVRRERLGVFLERLERVAKRARERGRRASIAAPVAVAA